ncbi:hypothetical protein [Streptomyces sp. NRRL S-920]|uniref:hypothetical protein n=1 Tax=Streptomyces sp. NRRL S-920 TaxID=1463921 RepID=UPI0004C9A482|nr:hypothetical protein [Streptomyces sp. NRRL S-920]
MDRCRAPFRVPPELIETAVALVGRDANAGDVPLFVHCELDGHLEGFHAVHLLFVPDTSGRAAWVFWREHESRVQLKDPCQERNGPGDICLLFAEHPGDHLFPSNANSAAHELS